MRRPLWVINGSRGPAAGCLLCPPPPESGHWTAIPGGPFSADIVAKSKIEQPKKSRESRSQGFSAAASLASATAEVRGRFRMKRYGPSRRRAQNASAALIIFVPHPKKTFATVSTLNGPRLQPLPHGCRSRCEARQNRSAWSEGHGPPLPGLSASYCRRRRR